MPPFLRAALKDAPHVTILNCPICDQKREIKFSGHLKPASTNCSLSCRPCRSGGKDGKCMNSTISITEEIGGAVFHHVNYLHFQYLLTFKRDALDEDLVYPKELTNYMKYKGSGKVKKSREEKDVFEFFEYQMERHKSAYMTFPLDGTHDTPKTRAEALT